MTSLPSLQQFSVLTVAHSLRPFASNGSGISLLIRFNMNISRPHIPCCRLQPRLLFLPCRPAVLLQRILLAHISMHTRHPNPNAVALASLLRKTSSPSLARPLQPVTLAIALPRLASPHGPVLPPQRTNPVLRRLIPQDLIPRIRPVQIPIPTMLKSLRPTTLIL